MATFFEIAQDLGITPDWMMQSFECRCEMGFSFYLPGQSQCRQQLFWTDEVYRLYGMSPEQPLTLDTILSRVYPDDRILYLSLFSDMESEEPTRLIYRCISGDGIRWLEYRGWFYRQNGTPFAAGIVRDITWISRQDDRLRLESESFATITRYLAEAADVRDMESVLSCIQKTVSTQVNLLFITLILPASGKLTHVLPKNCPYQEIFLFQKDEEYLADRVFKSGCVSSCAVEDYPNRTSAQLMKKAGGTQIVCFPVKNRKKVIAVLSAVLIQSEPLSEEQNIFFRNLCSYLSSQLHNQFLYRQLEKELSDQKSLESDMNTLFYKSRDFIAILSINGQFIRVNHMVSHALGYSPEELSGRSVLDFLHPDDINYMKYIRSTVRKENVVRGVRSRFITRDGGIVFVENSLHYVQSPEMLIVIGRQVEEQKSLEEQNVELEIAASLEELKNEFFSNFSHEFKTPLNVILSSLDLVKVKMCRENETQYHREYERFFNYAYQNCYRLLRLTTNLLDATRVDSGALVPRFIPCDLGELGAEIAEAAQPYLISRKISVFFSREWQGASRLACDVGQMDRILLNLISNAAKSMPDGGSIQIILRGGSEFLSLSVMDTGTGIDPKTIPYIFEKFCIEKNGLVRASDGSGIGLFLVKAMTEMHRGTVTVESKPGKGSCFTVSIPKNLTPAEGTDTADEWELAANRESRQSRISLELSDLD